MSKFTAILLTVFSLLSFALPASAEVTFTKKEVTVTPDTRFLFVQTSQTGSIQRKGDSNDYVVVLHDVEPWVTYFSDVPKRITGFMSIEDFISLTSEQIKTKYPKGLNSGIIASEPNKKDLMRLVVTLRDFIYSPKDKTLTFIATTVPGDQTHVVENKATLSHTALFIDSVCIRCGAVS